jgi:hypothetical protein
MQIKIVPNDTGNPPGKLADAELHFGPEDGALTGLKLIGFSVWERRGSREAGAGSAKPSGGTEKNVTFPARSYSVNGERRSFALLRPIQYVEAQQTIRDAIIEAYKQSEGGE